MLLKGRIDCARTGASLISPLKTKDGFRERCVLLLAIGFLAATFARTFVRLTPAPMRRGGQSFKPNKERGPGFLSKKFCRFRINRRLKPNGAAPPSPAPKGAGWFEMLV